MQLHERSKIPVDYCSSDVRQYSDPAGHKSETDLASTIMEYAKAGVDFVYLDVNERPSGSFLRWQLSVSSQSGSWTIL